MEVSGCRFVVRIGLLYLINITFGLIFMYFYPPYVRSNCSFWGACNKVVVGGIW